MQKTPTQYLYMGLLASVAVGCAGASQPVETSSYGAARPDEPTVEQAASASETTPKRNETARQTAARDVKHEATASDPQTTDGAAQSPRPSGSSEQEPIQVIDGRATYYADSFAGKVTKSGEIYKPQELTAATKNLPMGTIVRVVRRDTKASVKVRVNDRLPERMGATIDLSRAAAEKLDMIEAGIVPVRVEILSKPDKTHGEQSRGST